MASCAKPLLMLILLCAPCSLMAAGGEEIMDLARHHYRAGDNNAAVLETMRYNYLYPSGPLYGESLCLQGRARYRMGETDRALALFEAARDRDPGGQAGQEALYRQAMVHILGGSPATGMYYLQTYRGMFPAGAFSRDAAYLQCCARALRKDFTGAMTEIRRYRETWGDDESILSLEERVAAESLRKDKSIPVAAVGSLFLPGFGYFYAGRYMMALLVIATECVCAGLMYQGYRNDNMYQVALFSVLGLAFHQYSIYGGIRSVREYNSREPFRREVRLGISARM